MIKRVRVAADRWNFETSAGEYVTPIGGNMLDDQHPAQGTLFQNFDPADSGRQLDLDCRFWKLFCGHFKDCPAIWAWDLRNELLFSVHSHITNPGSTEERKIEAMLKDGWPRWLETRYGSVEAMNRAYSAKFADFRSVPGSISFIEKPFDLCAYDFRFI